MAGLYKKEVINQLNLVEYNARGVTLDKNVDIWRMKKIEEAIRDIKKILFGFLLCIIGGFMFLYCGQVLSFLGFGLALFGIYYALIYIFKKESNSKDNWWYTPQRQNTPQY